MNPTTIDEASVQVANLPATATVGLSGGREISVSRLSWLQFEAVWADLAGVLTAILAAGEQAGPEQLLACLAGLPGRLTKLAGLASGLGEPALAALPFDDVLAIAAGTVRLNFLDSAGLRDFFAAAGRLAGLAG